MRSGEKGRVWGKRRSARRLNEQAQACVAKPVSVFVEKCFGVEATYDLPDHDVKARLKKAPQAFGALRRKIFSSCNIPGRLKGELCAGGVLAVSLYDCESWCLTHGRVGAAAG
jgi:hypothetical protein